MSNFKLHKLLVAIVCAVLIVVMLTSCGLFPSQEEPATPTLKTPKPIQYSFFAVEKADLESKIEGTGTVTSIYYTSHSFQTSGGKLKGLYVSLGDTVEKGQLLMELDNSSIEMDYLQATIDYELGKETFSNAKKKHDSGLISDVEYRIEELTFQSIEKRYTNLKSAYNNTKLYAKVSGKVVYINTAYTTAAGKEIIAGDPVVAIDSQDPKYTYVVFDKTFNSEGKEYTPEQFRIGAKLRLNEWYNDDKTNDIVYFDGEMVGTDQIIKDTGLNYVSSSTFYCKMINPPDNIEHGDTVRYNYTVFKKEKVLQIPVSAYFEYDGTTYVYVLDKSTNLKKEIVVELGMRNQTRVEVVSGLKLGDLIVMP
ncbi:MAG: hypothetical protein IKJ75_00945 [Clostridia bacterium]|nr:hypothetical protein [Clostridia bacterium]